MLDELISGVKTISCTTSHSLGPSKTAPGDEAKKERERGCWDRTEGRRRDREEAKKEREAVGTGLKEGGGTGKRLRKRERLLGQD